MATKFLDFKTLNPPYSATSRREGLGQEPYGGDLQEVGRYHVQRQYCNGSNTVFTSFDNSGRLYSRSSSFYSQRQESWQDWPKAILLSVGSGATLALQVPQPALSTC